MLPWIVYALAVALLLTGAAAAAERWLRPTGRQTRWAWLCAMLLSVGLPAAYLVSPFPGGHPGPDVLPGGWMPAALLESSSAADAGTSDPGTRFPPLEVWFPWMWASLSAGLLAWLGRSALRLRRICGSRTTLSDGDPPVHRTTRIGPGVVGVRRPRIVVPDWVQELDGARRDVIFLHEREHARCRDPLLLHAGWALLALVPWLLPLWWQFRRLRMAVEMDCDRRVVDRVGDARAYGQVLLEAKRYALGLGSPLLTAGGSFLGRRVRRLVEPGDGRPAHGLRRAATAVAGALALAAAALLPPPGAQAAEEAVAEGAAPQLPPVDRELFDRISATYDRGPRVLNAEEVRDRLRARHPEELRRRGIGGQVQLALHVAADGHVTGGFVNVSSGHRALDRAAMEVAASVRYAPAQRSGEAVAVWIVQPLRFRVEPDASASQDGREER